MSWIAVEEEMDAPPLRLVGPFETRQAAENFARTAPRSGWSLWDVYECEPVPDK